MIFVAAAIVVVVVKGKVTTKLPRFDFFPMIFYFTFSGLCGSDMPMIQYILTLKNKQ